MRTLTTCASSGSFTRCMFGYGTNVAAVCVRGGNNGDMSEIVFHCCTFGYGPHITGSIEASMSPISLLSPLSCVASVTGTTIIKMPNPGNPVYNGMTCLLCDTQAGACSFLSHV